MVEPFQMGYTAIGGLGIFILGMKYLSDSLQSLSGGLIRKAISSVTSNRFLAVLVGLVITSVPSPQPAQAEGSLPNPGYPDACGLEVALVIDTSQSITSADQGGGAQNPGLMTRAASQFVEALSGTPSSVAVSSFRTAARTEIGYFFSALDLI